MVVVIDYGMGNIGSILNMLKRIGVEAVISADAQEIQAADKLILPGVGAFDHGMKNIHDRGLFKVLNDTVMGNRIPILGICLGMQLFGLSSEEGSLDGFMWLPARAVRFRNEGAQKPLRIPHMGWNAITIRRMSPLFRGLEMDCRFYFVHSYHMECENMEDVVATANYGYDFVCAMARDNLIGVQFHPEKSHRFGMMLLKNFVEVV